MNWKNPWLWIAAAAVVFVSILGATYATAAPARIPVPIEEADSRVSAEPCPCAGCVSKREREKPTPIASGGNHTIYRDGEVQGQPYPWTCTGCGSNVWKLDVYMPSTGNTETFTMNMNLPLSDGAIIDVYDAFSDYIIDNDNVAPPAPVFWVPFPPPSGQQATEGIAPK